MTYGAGESEWDASLIEVDISNNREVILDWDTVCKSLPIVPILALMIYIEIHN